MKVSVLPDPDGRWLAVVAARAVLVIDTSDSAAPVDELHEALRAEDPTRAVLALIVADGLERLPAFALVSLGARAGSGAAARVVLRGPVTVSSGADRISGGDVETWTERSLSVEQELRIATPAPGRAPLLPLVDGAGWAAELVLALEGAAPTVPPTAAPRAPATAAPSVPATAPTQIDEHTISEPQDEVSGYDHLFEATVMRPVEDAAVRPDAPTDESDLAADADDNDHPAADGNADGDSHADDGDDDGDHDGYTVFSGQLDDVKGRARPHPSEIAGPDAAPTFWIRMPDGTREPLATAVLVGRAPTARVSEGAMPRLVTLAGDPDISRTHVKFSLEGDTVVVTDLHSRNGTSVVLPAKSPQLLRAGESTTVIAGTVVDLGGGTTMIVEQDPS